MDQGVAMPAGSGAAGGGEAGNERSVDSDAKVFISYSRRDGSGFAAELAQALKDKGFDAFLDKTDIAPGEAWQERLSGLIAAADTVVFVVTPGSLASKVCGWELEESARLGKRVLPIAPRRVEAADAPTVLTRLNWIFCAEDDDRAAALAALEQALHTDLPWVREHTRLGELARRWEAQGRPAGATLRGADLEAAERWLDRRPADANAPTALHQDFIRASRRVATARQRRWIGGSLIVALIAVALAGFAEVSRRQAQHERRQADVQRLSAERARNEAETQRGRAEAALKEAQTQRDRAQRTLALATKTANALVFDLAQKFRYVVGVPITTIKAILDRALELQSQLVGEGETDPDLLFGQAGALAEADLTLQSLGDTAGALADARKAVDILTSLLKTQPDNKLWLQNLSLVDEHVADMLQLLGKRDEALASYRAALAIMDRLAKADPVNEDWQRGMADAYHGIGRILAAQGKLDEALAAYRQSSAIAERLAKSDPGNSQWQSELSSAYEGIGDVLEAQGKLDEALASYLASLPIRERQARSDPGNSKWQFSLSVTYYDIGDILMAQRKFEEALPAYRSARAIAERLVKSDPDNANWKIDLSAADEDVGDALKAQGKLDEALNSYRESIAILERLTKSYPSNSKWQEVLRVVYHSVADVLQAQGKLQDALVAYRASLSIAEILAKLDPGNATWRGYFRDTTGDIGSLSYKLTLAHDFADALEAADEAIAVAPELVWLYENRAHALMFLKRTAEARAIYLKYRGTPNVLDKQSWDEIVLADFAELRKAGLLDPLMDEIEAAFAALK